MNVQRLLPALCLLFALAAASPAPANPPAAASTNVIIAESVSWNGFVKYWKGFGHRADRIVLVVALVGGLAFFIILRGKWR